MYPDAPYPGCTWPLTQHMGVVSDATLKHMLLAAAMHTNTRDPTADITNYMVANGILTNNVRSDSGQADAWRDYQQMLSELGFIYSTQIQPEITPTPLGLAFLDGLVTYSEVITLQALRYQYPNGHKLVIDDSLRREISGKPYAKVSKLAELQQMTGVCLRPGVLVWRVLRELVLRGETPELTVTEIQSYLMRCSTCEDTNACTDAIISARNGGPTLARMSRGRRNSQDWMKFLGYTPLFDAKTGKKARIKLSSYGYAHATDIDAICEKLEATTSFWLPTMLDAEDRKTWYSEFGSLRLDIDLIPQEMTSHALTAEEREEVEQLGAYTNVITLRNFEEKALNSTATAEDFSGRTITSTYDSGIANNQHRLHDLMVIYIARICKNKGARVYDDPISVDLLIDYRDEEYIVEVKSATPHNFVGRLRYALGQVLEYDYRRSLQVHTRRRKVIAIAAQVAPTSWSIPFLNDHLDIDMLSLQDQVLRVDSHRQTTHHLFTPPNTELTLGL